MSADNFSNENEEKGCDRIAAKGQRYCSGL